MELPQRIETEEQLRAIIGEPSDVVVSKIADRLNSLTRQFVERSPFVCVATTRPDGGVDVSPRGDPAGFVRILDERTLLLPDRPGNRIADTLTNLLADPRIGLLFLIPGVGDSFRVNGRAVLTDDPELLAPSTVEGKPPRRLPGVGGGLRRGDAGKRRVSGASGAGSSRRPRPPARRSSARGRSAAVPTRRTACGRRCRLRASRRPSRATTGSCRRSRWRRS